jgi:Prp18 domain
MIEYMKEGEFVRAHDIYMLTAIGNAPWPIGLTMVGIHERSGREKVIALILA